MCFSLEVSLGTGIFSWAVCFYLLQKKLTLIRRQYVIFLLIFSSIQFADAILWYIKMENNIINYLVSSYLIPAILSLMIIYNIFVIKKNKNILISLFILIAIIYIFIRLNGYSKGSCNKFSSPIWGGNEVELWEIIVYAILIMPTLSLLGDGKSPYPVPSLIISSLILIYYNIENTGGYGSFWCAIANITALYYLYNF